MAPSEGQCLGEQFQNAICAKSCGGQILIASSQGTTVYGQDPSHLYTLHASGEVWIELIGTKHFVVIAIRDDVAAARWMTLNCK